MPFRVEFAARAERDLDNIFQFIHAIESGAATKWFDGLEHAIDGLATLPERGAVTEYDRKLRCLLYGNKPHIYRILYRIDARAHCITIRHIRHCARKPLKKL
ncbi:MAG TPA: type II toxin-antitoxin system RelE/ParE family toxin [Acidobacteriaceae bacterium]